MKARVGDIVLARNRYKKTGRYIIAKFGKRQATFRGVAVVNSLRESQKPDNVLDLGAWGYAILTLAYSDLNPADIIQITTSLGEVYGEQIERRWKDARQSKYASEGSSRCFNVGRYTPTVRSLPRQVTKICTGGMIRPK